MLSFSPRRRGCCPIIPNRFGLFWIRCCKSCSRRCYHELAVFAGNYAVGVHIADVSHYVMPGSALDTEAANRSVACVCVYVCLIRFLCSLCRGTSVYLVQKRIDMIPSLLSTGNRKFICVCVDVCHNSLSLVRLLLLRVFELPVFLYAALHVSLQICARCIRTSSAW